MFSIESEPCPYCEGGTVWVTNHRDMVEEGLECGECKGTGIKETNQEYEPLRA